MGLMARCDEIRSPSYLANAAVLKGFGAKDVNARCPLSRVAVRSKVIGLSLMSDIAVCVADGLDDRVNVLRLCVVLVLTLALWHEMMITQENMMKYRTGQSAGRNRVLLLEFFGDFVVVVVEQTARLSCEV